jgi:hypothetical protein
MTHAFKTLKPAGLLAIMLGLMAFSANAAQAEPGARWNVAGSPISSLLPKINAKLEGATIILLTTVGKRQSKSYAQPILSKAQNCTN